MCICGVFVDWQLGPLFLRSVSPENTSRLLFEGLPVVYFYTAWLCRHLCVTPTFGDRSQVCPASVWFVPCTSGHRLGMGTCLPTEWKATHQGRLSNSSNCNWSCSWGSGRFLMLIFSSGQSNMRFLKWSSFFFERQVKRALYSVLAQSSWHPGRWTLHPWFTDAETGTKGQLIQGRTTNTK